MKKLILLLLLGLVFFSCKNANTENVNTDSYALGLENCLKVKQENPEAASYYMIDCMVGSELPRFEAKSIDGKVISTEMLKGKVSIVNFWFTTCAPCIAEVPGFNAIVDKYGKDKVNYISIARNNKDEIEKFLEKHPWNFTHIPNEGEIIADVFKMDFGYPTTYLLDKDARIIRSFSGGGMGDQAVADIQNKLVPMIEKELE